jgi:nucleoid DNA-binding protein
MNIFKTVAEKTEQKSKLVRMIYEAVVAQVNQGLKKDRRFRLPGLGILAVKYKPARKARKGINPFTKQPTVFKAKPASNKLKFRPSKEMKEFVNKLEKVAPKKRHKKGGK